MISWTYEQDAPQSSLGSDVRIPPGPEGVGLFFVSTTVVVELTSMVSTAANLAAVLSEH